MLSFHTLFKLLLCASLIYHCLRDLTNPNSQIKELVAGNHNFMEWCSGLFTIVTALIFYIAAISILVEIVGWIVFSILCVLWNILYIYRIRDRLAIDLRLNLLGRTSVTNFHKLISDSDPFPISVVYLGFMKKKLLIIKSLTLSFVIVSLKFSHLQPYVSKVDIIILGYVVLGYYLAIIFKEIILGIRIRGGVFGTNEREARDLLNFIYENSEDINFHDGSGGIRKALYPETDHVSVASGSSVEVFP